MENKVNSKDTQGGVKVYLVGTPEGAKVNQWEAMTNSWSLAEAKKAELGPQAVHKVVTVPPKGRQRRAHK